MDNSEERERYERNLPRLPTDQKDIVGKDPGLSDHHNDVIANNFHVGIVCVIDVHRLSSELKLYVWGGGKRMMRAFLEIHDSKRCMWFGLFFQIAVPISQLGGQVARRTDPALHEHHRQVVVFNVEAIREDRQRLMEIDIIP